MLHRANNGKKESDGGREFICHFIVAHVIIMTANYWSRIIKRRGMIFNN